MATFRDIEAKILLMTRANQAWQPTPDGALGVFRLPLARRGCTLRSAEGAMNATDILREWVLPLLLYTGAVVPLSVALMLDRHSIDRHRRHRRLFFVLVAVQAVSFLPFVTALVLRLPHALHVLIWPALVGIVMFVWSLLVLLGECFLRLQPRFGGPIAEPCAPPNGGPAERLGNSEARGRPPSVS